MTRGGRRRRVVACALLLVAAAVAGEAAAAGTVARRVLARAGGGAPKITAQLCNGVPCSQIGKPLPSSEPGDEGAEAASRSAPGHEEKAPEHEHKKKEPAHKPQEKEEDASATQPLAGGATRRKEDGSVDFGASPPRVTTEPVPVWCHDALHARDPECLRALPNRWDGRGARGPTGRRHEEGYHPMYKQGPVGRRSGEDAVRAHFVDKLNTTGDSPLGRVSVDKMAELLDRKKHPWLYRPRVNRTAGERTWFYLDDSNQFGVTGESSSPVGRLEGGDALRALAKARRAQEAKEEEVWKADLKTGAEGEDLAPKARVRWMHYDTFQELEKKRRAGEPDVTPDNNGFRHANDRDFQNFEMRPGVRVLPPIRDGPDFNLDNAINHPERLFNSLESDRKEKEGAREKAEADAKAADHPGDDFPGAANVAVEAEGQEHTDPVTGKVVPHVVESLPGAAGLESEVTGADKVDDTVEDWSGRLPVRAAVAPGREPGVTHDVLDEDRREAAAEAEHPRDPAYHPRGEDRESSSSSSAAAAAKDAQGQQQPAAGGNDPSPAEQARAIQQQLAAMRARQKRVELEVLATRAQIHEAGSSPIRERIAGGYGDEVEKRAFEAGPDAGDAEAAAATADQAARISSQLARLRVKQDAVQEQVHKTQHRLVSRLPAAHLGEIRARIHNGYADFV